MGRYLAGPPAFQFYPRDWIVDTRHLPWDQQGRYLAALCESWIARSYGRAPEDQWRAWLGYSPEEWPAVRSVFAELFKIRGEEWVQKRLSSVRREQQRHSKRAQAGGRAKADKAAARQTDTSTPQAGDKQAPSTALQSASASAVKTESKTSRAKTELSAERPGDQPAVTASSHSRSENPNGENRGTPTAIGGIVGSLMQQLGGSSNVPIARGTLTGADLSTEEGVAMERDAQKAAYSRQLEDAESRSPGRDS